MAVFSCPKCLHTKPAPDAYIGLTVKCLKCDTRSEIAKGESAHPQPIEVLLSASELDTGHESTEKTKSARVSEIPVTREEILALFEAVNDLFKGFEALGEMQKNTRTVFNAINEANQSNVAMLHELKEQVCDLRLQNCVLVRILISKGYIRDFRHFETMTARIEAFTDQELAKFRDAGNPE